MTLRQDPLDHVSRETLEALKQYEHLLKKWNPKINLVAPASLSETWDRHIKDSAQIFWLANREAKVWLDFGSGAGFPGLVCATLAKYEKSKTRFALVESDSRKCAFLRTVNRELNLNVEIHNQRAEVLTGQDADIISARALAPLDKLLFFAQKHMKPTTQMLFPKGQNWASEKKAAEVNWRFSCVEHPSITLKEAVVLEIGDVVHA
ncbi:Ribosomal RNA small subunit methyltransferase G [Pelagimonas phthalicica]|uniref:Ribosomal RNA small subunit methyltransferase G n=1 Tax=Pelagimonas phthalicica TaxID=1037362 RepID=A0A238J7N4_9RHOB|nr:16S rRNA (guanine(527)-N(7))-methyltransferase RsmG [Pelagimonas phthalicica]TDS95309.1 16S rRNA m(7)G-527 methyltransferase [Pelagimonas phthalicica]SMX26167.1 Ribosomal RNA small subunit methyltransferase G [Pelagimonas phthalicica]